MVVNGLNVDVIAATGPVGVERLTLFSHAGSFLETGLEGSERITVAILRAEEHVMHSQPSSSSGFSRIACAARSLMSATAWSAMACLLDDSVWSGLVFESAAFAI